MVKKNMFHRETAFWKLNPKKINQVKFKFKWSKKIA